MKCPDCGENLKEVLASARYGAKIKIDQYQNEKVCCNLR